MANTEPDSPEAILRVEHLVTTFDTEEGRLTAVDDVSFAVRRGRTLGIVGESGCGKSVTALSVMRLLPKPMGNIQSGRVMFGDTDLARLPAEEMHAIRGRRMTMIFQEPMTALNPVHRIGRQIGEVFELHASQMSEDDIVQTTLALLEQVGISEPERRLREYPHQISGGMRQRVMIAMALAGKPHLLIADEPTTALDVTIQAQILELMRDLQREVGMAVMFITHDLGVIAEMSHDVVVMYAGQVVESAPVRNLFDNPCHPYTRGLLNAIPRLEYTRKTELNDIPGMVPSLLDLPVGCRFENRCSKAMPVCAQAPPAVYDVDETHQVRCYLYDPQQTPHSEP